MVMFVAEHNLPFRILEHMPKLVSNMCPDSEVAKNLKCSRTKGTVLVCKHCAPEDLVNICRLLQHRKYSLVIDETTNMSTSKCLAVVVRVYDNYTKDKFLTLLKVENATAEGAALEDNLQAAKCITNALRNPIYKVYYTFLSFILNIVNKLNLLFQREKPSITSLLSVLKKHFKILLRSFLKHDYVEKTKINSIDPLNVHQYSNIENMYFGATTELLYATLSKDELLTFKKHALDFYITLSLQIKKRIDFNDTILNAVEALQPEAVMMDQEKRQHSIVHLLKLFPDIIKEDEFEILNSEWRLIPEFQEKLKTIDDPKEFWIKISNIKDEEHCFLFKNISYFTLSILSLPHSSASTERIFPQLNHIKNKMRSRLHVGTCDVLLHTKQLLGGEICCNWNPSTVIATINKQTNRIDPEGTVTTTINKQTNRTDPEGTVTTTIN
ncbi:hypothetical protein JTB14_008696 [Gonioctena quinquepunctata]|nr:hypothetical protein JTB14_008696 [Gonioctena quinquepunctata]